MHSTKLAGCETEGIYILSAMATISKLTMIAVYRMGTDENDCLKAPEIQSMYSLNQPVSEIRTKIRQEFERHRYVNQLPVVDMLLFQSHAEYQVCLKSDLFNRRHERGESWCDQTAKECGVSLDGS